MLECCVLCPISLYLGLCILHFLRATFEIFDVVWHLAPETRPSTAASAGEKDTMSALVDQLHCGVQLRKTKLGHLIRGFDSTPGQRSATPSWRCRSCFSLHLSNFYSPLNGRSTYINTKKKQSDGNTRSKKQQRDIYIT